MGTHPIFESDFDCLTDKKMVKIVDSEDTFNAAINGDVLVCVDFFATWCGPCKMIAPKLEAMSKEFEGKVIFLKVDVDELEDLAASQEVRRCQHFHFSRVEKNLIRLPVPMKQEFVKQLTSTYRNLESPLLIHSIKIISIAGVIAVLLYYCRKYMFRKIAID